MLDEENTAYFELEKLAIDLNFKSITQDEIKQGNNIYALLHLIDKQQKEIEKLEEENEHYKDLMYALETYYSIIEEDLENCIKKDI